jgi:hypothetical protein
MERGGVLTMTINLKDILNSKFNKPVEEVSSKNVASMKISDLSSTKSVSIKIEKIIMGENGSRTNYSVSMDHTFTDAKDLVEVLDTLGYNERKGIWKRLGGYMKFRK